MVGDLLFESRPESGPSVQPDPAPAKGAGAPSSAAYARGSTVHPRLLSGSSYWVV